MNKKIKTQFISRRPELRSAGEDEPSVISGYAAVFWNPDDPETEYRISENVTERIAPTAFDTVHDGDVISTLNHDPNFLLGRTKAGTLTLEVDRVGLRYEIPIRDDDPDHQKVVSKLKAGDLDGSSFWFQIEEEEKTVEDNKVHFLLKRCSLIECGPVVIPAYNATTSELRSAHQAERIREAEAVAEPEAEAEPEIDFEAKKKADLDYIAAQLWELWLEDDV